MTTATFRWTRSATVLATVLALAACAHVPYAPRASIAKPAVRVTLSPPPGTVVTPSASEAPIPSRPAPSISPRTPEPVAGINPARYANLLDRMRAGFRLPDVQSRRITRELNWFVDNPKWVQGAFRRAQLYLYSIVTQVEARHMPLEIALLPVIESAYQPYAYSRARAVGLWQFEAQTARRFGLKIDWWYDGRRDVVESTRAALDYLQYLHNMFNGNWLLAIAAYDCGSGAVEQAIRDNERWHRPTDFWHLRLPFETEYYVPKLLAMRDLVEDPAAYGLSFSPIPNHPYFTRVATHGPIDLDVAAEIAGVSPKAIYELNPAFDRWVTDPSGPYYLLVPTGAAAAFRANVVQLTPDERLRVTHYTVQNGDTLYRIAQRFHTEPVMLRELNRLPLRDRLVVGTTLEIPSNVDVHALPRRVLLAAARVDARYRGMWYPTIRVVVRPGESLWAIAVRHHMSVRRLAMLNGLRVNGILRPGESLRLRPTAYDYRSGAYGPYSVVRPGDSLWAIAQRHGMSVDSLAMLNGLRRNSILRVGERLRVTSTAKRAAPRVDRRVAREVDGKYSVVHPGDSLWGIAQRHGMSVDSLAMLNGLRRNSVLHVGERLRLSSAARLDPHVAPEQSPQVRHSVTYTVRAGDTLYHISRIFQVSVRAIMVWNRLVRSNLWPGQHLRILVAER